MVAGGSQFAERAIDRLVFARELERQLLGRLIDRDQPFKFPQACRVAGKDLLEVMAHARNPFTVEGVAAFEALFFKSFRPVGLATDQHRLTPNPLVQHRPERLERLVVCGKELQMAVPRRLFPVRNHTHIRQRGRQLPVTLAMRLEMFELLHRGQQGAVGFLQREFLDGVAGGQKGFGVEKITMILQHAPRHSARTGPSLVVSVRALWRGACWRIIVIFSTPKPFWPPATPSRNSRWRKPTAPCWPRCKSSNISSRIASVTGNWRPRWRMCVWLRTGNSRRGTAI